VKYRNPVNGYEFINGDRNELDKKDVYTSEELAKIDPEIQGNVVLAMVREELGGKVTECRPEDPGIVPF
jgi:hypothetical protein